MAEEQNNEQSVADALEDKPEKGAGGRGKILRLLLPVAIAVIAGAGGHVASKMLAGGSTPAQAAAADGQTPQQGDSPDDDFGNPADGNEEYVYYKMEPIVANLDEPKLTRYVRVTLTLALRKEGAKEAIEVIEARMPDLVTWVNVYFADCSLDDLRGGKNRNRILRDILDSFNDRLWPKQRPRIVRVESKDFFVQ